MRKRAVIYHSVGSSLATRHNISFDIYDVRHILNDIHKINLLWAHRLQFISALNMLHYGSVFELESGRLLDYPLYIYRLMSNTMVKFSSFTLYKNMLQFSLHSH